MKKLWITVALAVMSYISVYSQLPDTEIILTPLPDTEDIVMPDPLQEYAVVERIKPVFNHGIAAGYLGSAATFITQNGKQNIRTHSGFTIGWSVSMPFADVWSFDTGAMFSLWGFRYETSAMKINDNRFMIEIPATLTFFERDAYFPIFLQAGILAGICTGGNQKITVYDNDKSWHSPDTGTLFPKISFGLIFAIGYSNFTVQFINNFTGIWSREMSYQWETFTGNTIDRQTPRAVSLIYTYWF